MRNYQIIKFTVIPLLFFLSCATEESRETVICKDYSCEATFVIDVVQNPGSYQDESGVWHVKYSGLNYFRIKGSTDELNPDYVINGVPLMETAYDSNYFFIPGVVTWTYPVYSFLGLFTNSNLTKPIPVGYQSYSFAQLVNDYSITNIVGYEITKHTAFDKPYSPTLFATYSKYNSHPTQQIIFFREMIGDTAEIYIKVTWGEVLKKQYTLKIKFEK